MTTSASFDIEALLNPISEENPVGEDLRMDSSPTSMYYQIKDTRNQARAAERQMLMTGEGEPPVWSPILEMVPEVLSSMTKDLELTTYFIEALCREYGFAGLRDGFRLVRELVERFGDSIYPTPDEDGVETRLAPLTSLNGEGGDGTLCTPMRVIPLSQPSEAGEFNLADYQISQTLDRLSDEVRQRQIEQGAFTLEMINSTVAQTDISFYQTLYSDLEEALAELQSLTESLDARYGRDSPPTGTIRGILEETQTTLKYLVGDRLAAAAPLEEIEPLEEEAVTAEGQPAPAAAIASGSIQSRDDALRQISRLAEFFRKTEPHTPISFALERIVRWGRMPLPQLLRELSGETGNVDEVFKLVGISDRQSEDE